MAQNADQLTVCHECHTDVDRAVRASGTTLTGIFGVRPVIAATVITDTGDPARFPTADRFASHNGTAPIEISSGSWKIYRLSMATGASTTPFT